MYEATLPVGAPNQIQPMVYQVYHMCAQWETVQQYDEHCLTHQECVTNGR